MINYDIAPKIDNRNTVAILTTDLSAAFDLVDHQVLTRKWAYYGVNHWS